MFGQQFAQFVIQAGGLFGLGFFGGCLRLLLGLQRFQLLVGVTRFAFADQPRRLPIEIDPLGADPHGLEIAWQVHVAGQCTAHQLVGPWLARDQILMNAYLERAGVALEEGIGITPIPFVEQCLGGWRLADFQAALG